MATATFHTVARVGCVSVKKCLQSGKYFVGYWSPAKKRVVLDTCHTTSLKQARTIARAVDEGLKRDPAARFRTREPQTIEVAVAETIAGARTQNVHTKRTLEDMGHYLLAFLGRRYPGVRLWADVKNEHLAEWAQELAAAGKARKTIKNYTGFAIQVSRYMASAYPADRLYFPLVPPSGIVAKGQEARPVDYLSYQELIALADYARQRDLRAEAAILLSGLCGLRLTEIAWLTVHSIDFRAKTLTVGQSKTSSGLRTIPLPQIVVDRVHAQVEATPGPWLLTTYGRRAGDGRYSEYRIGDLVRPMQRELGRLEKHAHILDVDPKHLRKTAFNILKSAGVDPEYRRAYCGHAEGTVAGKHYEDRNSPRMVERLRREVIEPLEVYLLHMGTETDKKLTRGARD